MWNGCKRSPAKNLIGFPLVDQQSKRNRFTKRPLKSNL